MSTIEKDKKIIVVHSYNFFYFKLCIKRYEAKQATSNITGYELKKRS